jgi:hypothetical protein
MSTSPGPSISNNWGWTDILKKIFTFVELDPYTKWAAKPIGNKSNNTLKRWVTTHSKIRSEWQHTQEKDEHYNSRKDFKKIMKDQVGRIERS